MGRWPKRRCAMRCRSPDSSCRASSRSGACSRSFDDARGRRQRAMTVAAALERPATSVRTATLLVAFAACCFGSIPLFALVATRGGATLLAFLTWRYILALVILGIVAGRAIIAR